MKYFELNFLESSLFSNLIIEFPSVKGLLLYSINISFSYLDKLLNSGQFDTTNSFKAACGAIFIVANNFLQASD
jgi:hypothetical protein